jgi:uncharacterized membrane protein required for colicin V production
MNILDTYNIIDAFILVTVLATLIMGLWKGFIRTLSALTGLVVGVLAAFNYYPVAEGYLRKISELDPHVSTILSMAIVFIIVQALFVIVRKFLEALVDLTRLGWLDRVLGGCMGVLIGGVLVATVSQLLIVAAPEWPQVKNSKLLHPIEGVSTAALNQVPQSMKQHFQGVAAKWKGFQDAASASVYQQQTASPNRQPTGPQGPFK